LSSLILRLEPLSVRPGTPLNTLVPSPAAPPRLVPDPVAPDSEPETESRFEAGPASGPASETETAAVAAAPATQNNDADSDSATDSESEAGNGDDAVAEAVRRVVDLTSAERQFNATTLNRWSAAVAASYDACFVIDTNGIVISASVDAAELLGVADGMVIGRHILDVVTLVDLESGAPNPDYAPRITPLVVLEAPGLARSIMRVRRQDRSIATLDTSSAPIHDSHGDLLGSVTFLGRIPA
jgi:PAS domain-containing protein